jgi:hypothetical protein
MQAGQARFQGEVSAIMLARPRVTKTPAEERSSVFMMVESSAATKGALVSVANALEDGIENAIDPMLAEHRLFHSLRAMQKCFPQTSPLLCCRRLPYPRWLLSHQRARMLGQSCLLLSKYFLLLPKDILLVL